MNKITPGSKTKVLAGLHVSGRSHLHFKHHVWSESVCRNWVLFCTEHRNIIPAAETEHKRSVLGDEIFGF